MDLTRTHKVGPNERCPCGSGKKFKKCCRDAISAQSYSQQDRITALRRLDEYIDRLRAEEEDEAYHDLWGRFADRADQLPEHFTAMSNDVLDAWYAFDRSGSETEHPVVDDFLRDARNLTAGERAFLTTMRRTTMRLYEVVDVVPGVSLTLRDALDETRVTVHERSGSKTIAQNDWLAARVSPRGPSGRPEMEMGLLPVPHLYKDAVLAELREMYEEARADDALDAFHEALPPLFHDVWARAIFEPAVPELRNTGGELLVETRVTFDVLDAGRLASAFESAAEISREGEQRWTWSGDNPQGKPTSLGQLVLSGNTLVLECNSAERGVRGRALIESFAADAVRHRVTTHADLRRQVEEGLRSRILGGEEHGEPEPEIPSHVQEALVLGYYGKHYRAWIDEPVPALDGLTPRAAARDPRRRAAVADLIRGIESMYVTALREGEPAYDPSWMWSELDLVEADAVKHPPQLPHERIAEMIADSGALVSAVADRLRVAPGFDASDTVFTEADFAAAIDVQRFLRGERGAANESGSEPALAAPYLRFMINFELHRRKAFWVDESLAYMLGNTDIDLPGTELRVPFPSFALVFTDRHVLSLAERVVAHDKGAPLAGQLLRVVAAYVTEEEARANERGLTLAIACDALGSDLPHLVRHTLSTNAGPLQASLDAIAPSLDVDPEFADVDPLRGLLRVVVNAILYATSAQVRPERRTAPRTRKRGEDGRTFSSEEVYFLPGAIEISHVRKLQELARAPGGRVALRRFMVRGHWRRPAKNWEDQALRWVRPYWKGPSMAAVIERTYRMS